MQQKVELLFPIHGCMELKKSIQFLEDLSKDNK